jgi:5-methylcytosine-specific restriction protein A
LLQLQSEPLCASCLQRGIVRAATVADHVVPHNGDRASFLLGKLQSLCAECHNGPKHFFEARGYSRDVGEDGWPVDPNHPVYRNDPAR